MTADVPQPVSQVFPVCTFAGKEGLTDATLGWDAVYAVTYATINTDIGIRKPWISPLIGNGNGGGIDVSSGAADFSGGVIDGLAVVTGGAGSTVNFALTMTQALFSGTNVPSTQTSFTTYFSCLLAFSADPNIDGLQNLQVTEASVEATRVTIQSTTPQVASGDLSTMALELQALMQQFIDAAGVTAQLFSGTLANVFTQDYAECVDIPWLTPVSYNYAVADLPSPLSGGMLALLISTGTPTDNLPVEVQASAFPTNDGVNAMVALSINAITNGSFIENLNDNIEGSQLGDLVPLGPGTLTNAADINAFYRLNDDGTVDLIGEDDEADGVGATYALTIAQGSLMFTVAKQQIQVAINNAQVALGNGYTLELTMSSSYQLIVDRDGNIDISLDGTPTLTSSMSSPPAGAGPVVIDALVTAASVCGSELVAFLFDKTLNLLSTTAMTTARLADLSLDFFASVRQAQDTRRPVAMDITGQRQLAVSPNNVFMPDEACGMLRTDYKNSLRLNPALPDAYNDQLFPPQPDGNDTEMVPIADPGDQPPAGPNAKNDIADLVQAVGLKLIRNTRLRRAWRAACVSAVGADDNAQVNAALDNATNPTAWVDHVQSGDFEALYTGTIKFLNDGFAKGSISANLYIDIVRDNPQFTKNPGLDTPIFQSNRGLSVRTVATSLSGTDSASARLPSGVMASLRSAQFDGNARASFGKALIDQVIVNAPRPMWIKCIGVAGYLGGLVLGCYAGDTIGGAISGVVSGQAKATNIENTIDNAISPSDGGVPRSDATLFNNVSFPLMTTFESGGTTGPLPKNVLTCAAVNGGLILGVQLTAGV